MILDRQSFKYGDKVIIEKATFKPPYRHENTFQNEGCFVYFKNSNAKVLSSEDNITVAAKEAVLLKCDTYFIDMVKDSKEKTFEIFAIHLFPEILKKLYLNDLPAIIEKQTKKVKTRQVVDDVIISKFIESLEFYFQNPTLVNDDLLELKIKELILLLVQTKNVESILELISELYSTRKSNFRDIIKLHTYSNLNIEELAKLTNMSISTFKREFSKHFEESPTNYFNTEKLKKAKELLTISDLSIGDIAFEVGFNDPLYFTRLFKKKEGLTPSAFRSNHTE